MSPDDPRHGTNAGYTAHLKDKVPPCQPCRVAKNAYMRAYLAAESPDVLTAGHWECVRGVQRWVVDEPVVESLPAPPASPVPHCAECERDKTPLRRGLCPACYRRHRINGTIDRFQRVRGCAA